MSTGEMAPPVQSLWRQMLAEAREANQERRKLVLKHPDLAARLCEPPLSFSRPEVWSGFIPPRYLPEGSDGRARPDDSPRRAALVDISMEAMLRESEPAAEGAK